MAGSAYLNISLKSIFRVPRPELIRPGILAHGFRFPSGHTLGATVFYLSVLYLFWPILRTKSYSKQALCVVTVLIVIGLVGWSRLALGVHQPIDVIFSFLMGSGWVGIWAWLIQDELSSSAQPIPADPIDFESLKHLSYRNPQSIAVILNKSAGSILHGKQSVRKALEAAFRPCGNLLYLYSGRGKELVKGTKRAIHMGAKAIVIGGGDGSVHAAVNALAGTQIQLGVLPLGTLNHFAKDLGIPLALEQSILTVLQGEEKLVDLGAVNGHFFINNSSIGIYPRIVRRRDREIEILGKGKWRALISATWRVLKKVPLYDLEIETPEQRITLQTPFIFIGNNEYSTDLVKLGRREKLDSGILSIYISRKTDRWSLLGSALRAAFFGVDQTPDLEKINACSVHVKTNRKKVHVAFDGEVQTLTPPLHFKIHPKVLRVIAPKDQGSKQETGEQSKEESKNESKDQLTFEAS
jgi:diacylglycerol kinase family enzyme